MCLSVATDERIELVFCIQVFLDLWALPFYKFSPNSGLSKICHDTSTVAKPDIKKRQSATSYLLSTSGDDGERGKVL